MRWFPFQTLITLLDRIMASPNFMSRLERKWPVALPFPALWLDTESAFFTRLFYRTELFWVRRGPDHSPSLSIASQQLTTRMGEELELCRQSVLCVFMPVVYSPHLFNVQTQCFSNGSWNWFNTPSPALKKNRIENIKYIKWIKVLLHKTCFS